MVSVKRPKEGVSWYDPGDKFPKWLRDLWVLSHPWYTLWHLSYIPLGATLAPRLNWPLLGWTLLAFFLGMGIAAHCLDELNGRPLKTTLPAWLLWLLTGLGLGGALAIGIVIGVRESLWVIPCMVFGAFIVFAYNLELPRRKTSDSEYLWAFPIGFFHRDIWFGIAWGAFPVITAYVAQAHTVSLEAVLVAVFALLYSMAQRKLSLQARFFRRKVESVEGWYYLSSLHSGTRFAHPVTKDTIIRPVDLALKFMTWAVITLSLGLLLARWLQQ